MKDTIKLFAENYLHTSQNEKVFVRTDDGKDVIGVPINPADDLILMVKMFVDRIIDTSNISVNDIRNELLDQNLIIEQNGVYITFKRVKTSKLLNFVSRASSNNTTNDEIMKALKNLPNIISVNTENSINKMREQTIASIDEVYEKNNSEFRSHMKSDNLEFIHKMSTSMFDMVDMLKPKNLQKGEDNYSLPEEIEKIISECLLNAQQQNTDNNG